MATVWETLAMWIVVLHGNCCTADNTTSQPDLSQSNWTGNSVTRPDDNKLLDITTLSENSTFELICQNMSCEGRCGEESEIYRHKPCSCDSKCEMYRDCCVDYTLYCTNITSLSHLTSENAIFGGCKGLSCFQCVNHEHFAFKPVYMIASCPENYTDLATIHRCENFTSDLAFLHIPVFPHSLDYLYRNVYCALCHSVELPKLKTYVTEIFCQENDTDSKRYLEGRPLSQITFTEVTERRCKLSLEPPETEGIPERLCVPTDFDTCEHAGFLKNACDSYLEPVRVPVDESSLKFETLTFRNQHCVKCSPYRGRETYCWVRRITFPPFPQPGLKFSLLFDFTSIVHTGDKTTVSISTPGEVVTLDRFNQYTVDIYIHLTQYGNNDLQAIASSALQSEDVTVNVCDTGQSEDTEKNRTRNDNAIYKLRVRILTQREHVSDIIGRIQAFVDLTVLNVSAFHWVARNLNSSFDETCLSAPRKYQMETFLRLLKWKEGTVLTNNGTNQTDALGFPLEIISYYGNLHHLKSCAGVSVTKSLDDSVSRISSWATVCGESIEADCTLATYDIDELLNFTAQRNLSEVNISLVYRSGDFVTICKESLQPIITDNYDDGDPIGSEAEMYVTIICCSLSILGLIITVATYCLFVELRNLAGKCVLNLVIAMLLAQVAFLTSGTVAWRNPIACQGAAILQHFLWLSTFSWTNIMAFDLARTFSSKASIPRTHTSNKRYFVYFGLSWSVPLVIVVISVIINYSTDIVVGYGLNSVCWIRERYAMLVVFIAPVSVHIAINIVCFGYTIHHIRKVGKLASRMKINSENRSRLGAYARITAMMGFTWIIGYLGNIWHTEAIWIIFSLFNSLQGFVLFITFVLTTKVLSLYRKKFRKNMNTASSMRLASTSTSSSNLLTTSSTAL